MEARHYMKCLWNCVQFWLCCLMTLTLAQALSAFLLLPPLFNVGQVLWLSCLIVPLLSISLVGTPTDSVIMQRATGKNQCVISGQMAVFVLWCYGSKFFPTIITVLLWQGISLLVLCPAYTTSSTECSYVYPNITSDVTWGGWGLKPDMLTAIQNIALIIIVSHFVTISVSFVHREYCIWQKLPFNNWIWFLAAFIIICMQIAFSGSVLLQLLEGRIPKNGKFSFKLAFLFSRFFTTYFFINEFIKWQEIKVNVRYQKELA